MYSNKELPRPDGERRKCSQLTRLMGPYSIPCLIATLVGSGKIEYFFNILQGMIGTLMICRHRFNM